MSPRIVDGPSRTSFEDSFKELQDALDEYERIPPVVEKGSIANAIHESVSRYLHGNGIDINLPFHSCVLMSLGTSAAAGAALRSLFNSVGGAPHSVAQTLVRSMIMGASRVIYVYSESDVEEMAKKAVGVLAQEFTYAASAAREFSKFEHYVGLRRDKSWTDDLNEGARLLRNVSAPVSETGMIQTSTAFLREHIIANMENGEEVRRIPDEQIRYSWRFMSANAHGYSWPTLYGATANFSPGSPQDDIAWACILLNSAAQLAKQSSIAFSEEMDAEGEGS